MHRSRLGRVLAAILAAVMATSITVTASAVEIPTDRPDLSVVAGLYVNWDGSYELPDLGELSEEEQEIVKAMVDAAMQAKEAETQAETADENSVPIDPSTAAETAGTTDAETTPKTTETEMPLVVSFSDVPTTHTFYSGITYCAGKGIVGGYPDGTFRPANSVTKNHFSAMLSRAFYPDRIEKYNTDQYKEAYGTFGPTNMAAATSGTWDNTSFRWSINNASIMNTGINRYDMAQMMTNIMRAKGFAASSSQKTAAQAKITDYKNIPSQYQDAVKNVYALDIIGGYGDGSFKGTNIMNRGQAAIVIQRMAQYAPVKGDQDNDTYDDGTEQKPVPNPSTGNNTGSTNTGSNTGNTGNTGNTETAMPTPEPKPETPAANTLTNGKTITESNVKALLDELKAKWNKQDLGVYGQGNASPVRKVTNQYRISGTGRTISTVSGCGGGAARVFGQNATLRPVSGGYDAAHPGDLLVKLDADGKAMHVAIVYATNGTVDGIPMMTTIDANIGSAGVNKLLFGLGRTDPVKYDDPWAYAFYTAYPD